MTDLVLHDPATYAAGFPYEAFRELRDHDPMSHRDHPVWPQGYWVLSRYADVQRVSRDSATFHNAPHPFLEQGADSEDAGTSALLISMDGSEHIKMRKLVNRGFTPKRVADLTGRIRARIDALITGLAERDGCDLVNDLALWLPLHVIADLVGVPEADRRQVFEWTETTFGFDPAVQPHQRQEAAMAMYAYADAMCEERRDHPRDDLISVLMAADVDGEALSQMQIDIFFLLLQNAGSETTRNLITSGMLALLEHPDQYAILRNDLALVPQAIEELLRYTTPVMSFCRTASADAVVGGQEVRAGDRLLMVYASANRDERAFDRPDALDVTRQPNDHVAFGAGGPHFCLGASLARLEGKEMFEALLTRFDGLEVAAAPDTLPRVNSVLIDGFAHLPVTWRSVRAA